MGVIKRSVFLIGILIIFMMLFSLLLPRKISIAKLVEIRSSPERVMDLVNNLDQWKEWFPALKDSVSTIELFSANEAEIKRNNGNEMHIRAMMRSGDSASYEITSGSAVPVEMSFIVQKANVGLMSLHLIVNTKLKWYPWARAQGVFLDKFAGPQYQAALDNIKKISEGQDRP